MQFLAYLAALVTLLTATVSAVSLKGPITKDPSPITFKPNAVNPWSFDPAVEDTIYLNGLIHVPGKGAPVPYALPVTALAAKPASRKLGNLRGSDDVRALQASPICSLINISLGVTTINILGLVISIPQVTNIDVVGEVGLLGQLLCGLLSGSGLIASLVAGLQGAIAGLTSVAAALQYLTNLLNGAVPV